MENLGEFISITSKGKVKLKDKFFKTLLLGQQDGLVSKRCLFSKPGNLNLVPGNHNERKDLILIF